MNGNYLLVFNEEFRSFSMQNDSISNKDKSRLVYIILIKSSTETQFSNVFLDHLNIRNAISALAE